MDRQSRPRRRRRPRRGRGRGAALALACALGAGILSTRARAGGADAPRLGAFAQIEGARENQLLGLGLMVGLNGTGDRAASTRHLMANVLRRLRVNVSDDDLISKNVAAVALTATLPPFARPGSRIDVTVSSIGDAKSLLGGTLLLAPLEGPDGKVYAVAQGPISVGGFSFGGEAASAQRNHPTVGRIPNGALIERAVPMPIVSKEGTLRLLLREQSFETARRTQVALEKLVGVGRVRARDAGTLEVWVPPAERENLVGFAARLLDVRLRPAAPQRVVINERTGTIVVGEGVRISTVAVSHGNLTITISERPTASQPLPFGKTGDTTVLPRTDVSVREQRGALVVLPGGVPIGQLAESLNALGVTPRDLIAIFQALKRAGALQAELVIM